MTLNGLDSHLPESPSTSPSMAPLDHGARARALELRSEAQETTDRTQKSALLYEAGYLTEAVLHQPAHAVQDYLAAYNSDSRSRLPLFALLRMFERRSSYKNLARLYDAELRGARSAHEKSIALVDLACLDLIHSGDPQAATTRLTRALEHDTAGEAALLLEWNRRAANDREGALKALLARSEICDDPMQRGVLLLEIAHTCEQAGEQRAALEALRSAALGEHSHEIFLVALSRFARQHGFTSELVDSSERRAELHAAELRQRLTANEPDAALIELLRSRAVALWYEAARLRCTTLSDAQGAIECLGKALEVRPDDLLLRRLRMLSFDLLEDRKSAAEEAQALIAQGAQGEDAAPLHFRLAEHALVSGDTARARECLLEAIESAGDSTAAEAILDDLLVDEARPADRIERREARARKADPERACRWLVEAGLIAAHELKDAERARALFEQAEQRLPAQLDTARAAYGAALASGDDALTRFALDRLLSLEIEAQERAALLHHKLDTEPSDDLARSLLHAVLEPNPAWLTMAHIARQRAAEAGDFALLSQAHEALAALSTRDDDAVAHLSAAARASVREGNLERGRQLLERALSRDATHPYVTGLLEEVLRRLGQGEPLIELLRKNAEYQQTGENAEAALIAAGLAAERAADLPRARQMYEDAALRAPSSSSPLWCLLLLSERTGDAPSARRAHQRLAQIELTRGEAGMECLLSAELLDVANEGQSDALDRLTAALDGPRVAAHAALALTIGNGVSDEVRERALDVLEAHTEGAQRAAVERELLSAAVLASEPHARILDLSEEVLRLSASDPWAAFTKSCVPLPHDEDGHAATLLTLVEISADPRLKRALGAEAVWSRRLVRTGSLKDELDQLDARLKGAELSRVVLDTASPAHDSELRVRALEEQLAHSEGEEHAELLLALARAQLAAGQAKQALANLDAQLREAPDDACALELKRVAGRAAGDFLSVVEAAEALSLQVDDELSLALLEESAMVRIDELEDRAGAENVLTRVLARAPTRQVAYARLHDLLRDKADTGELVSLVRARTEQVHDAEELAKLFYELARLYRARGELPEALDAIDNVLMLEENVGALALAAEIHTSREEWEQAVGSLEAMASAAGVPKAQRRLCRLGAADFLEHRLKRPADALAQLQKLLDDGHDDLALRLRVTDVAERAGEPQRAVEALLVAARAAAPTEQVKHWLRAARLSRDALQQPEQADTLLRQVLQVQPLHSEALSELWAITRDRSVLSRYEVALRGALELSPLDAAPLRDLKLWADLAGDADASYVALLTLNVLGHASDEERRACDAALKAAIMVRPASGAKLTTADLSGLLVQPISPPYEALTRCVLSAAADIDQLEPGKFGVGRGQRIAARDHNPLREELEAMCGTLGLSLAEVYQGGNDLLRIAAVPRDEELLLVLGEGVSSPLSATRRSQLALQLAACHLQALPLLSRSNTQAARLMWAALVAAECLPVPPRPVPAWAEEDLGDMPRTLAKALPRKVRKALPELYRALPDSGQDMPRQCALLLQQTRRVALLIAGDLQAGLDSAVGALPSRETIAGSEAALDLIRAWTSGPMALLRKKLGLAK